MEVAEGLAPVGSRPDGFAYVGFRIALFGLATVGPLRLLPLTAIRAAVLVVAEVVLLAIYFGT